MSYISDIRKKIGHDPVFMPFSTGVIIQDNEMLLQKRKDDGTWSFHGGSLEFGETFEDALKREVKEELNIDIIDYDIISVESGEYRYHVYPNGDKIYAVGVVYFIKSYSGEIEPDDDEVSEIKWFPIDKLPEDMFHHDKVILAKVIDYYLRQKEEL